MGTPSRRTVSGVACSQAERGAGGEESDEDHALHPRVRGRREWQSDVVELQKAASEAPNQPDRVDDPDAERGM